MKKCKNCPNAVWYGDYALWYCKITLNTIKPEEKCHIDKTIVNSRVFND